MSERHPYAGENTLTPGETANDDPFIEQELCDQCKREVKPHPKTGKCPECGTEVR